MSVYDIIIIAVPCSETRQWILTYIYGLDMAKVKQGPCINLL